MIQRPRLTIAQVLPDPAPPRGARERVRTGVDRRIARARRRSLFLHAGVTAAVVVVLAVALVPRRARDVGAVREPGQHSLAVGATELSSHAQVIVGADASIDLVRDDVTGTLLRIDRGALVASVERRAAGQPFTVLANGVRVEVVGTVFAVGVGADGFVAVRGFEGSVRVIGAATDVRVGAGAVWTSRRPGRDPIDDVLLREAERLAAQRTAAAPPTIAPVAGRVTAPTAPGSAGFERRANATARAKPATPAPRAYAAARALEETGQLSRAIAAYRAIVGEPRASTPAPQAEDALYAVGRLERHALADPETARETFATYRMRYPNGRYARAVDLHLLELAIGRRDYATVEREANRFLFGHPRDPLATRFRTARAVARAERGDCLGARADLDGLPQSAATRWALDRCR